MTEPVYICEWEQFLWNIQSVIIVCFVTMIKYLMFPIPTYKHNASSLVFLHEIKLELSVLFPNWDKRDRATDMTWMMMTVR